jgi:hypothetical protein
MMFVTRITLAPVPSLHRVYKRIPDRATHATPVYVPFHESGTPS